MQTRGYEIARRAAPPALCHELRRTALLAAREQQREICKLRGERDVLACENSALRRALPDADGVWDPRL